MNIRFLTEQQMYMDHNGSADQGVLPPEHICEESLYFPEHRSSFNGIRLYCGSYVVCWKTWMVSDQQYSYHRLYYVCGGRAWYIAEGKKYLLKKNHLYILPVYPHHYSMEHDPSDPLEVLWCHFEIEPMLTNSLIEYDPGKDDEISAILAVWRAVTRLPKPGNEMYHTIALLLHVLERRVPFYYKDHPLIAVEKYMNDHIREHFTVEQLASEFGYSRAYFSREFKNVFNVSPARYMQITRMTRAAQMLRSGARVDEVCLALGYSDKKVFFRAFKAYHGMTTAQYTNKHKLQP